MSTEPMIPAAEVIALFRNLAAFLEAAGTDTHRLNFTAGALKYFFEDRADELAAGDLHWAKDVFRSDGFTSTIDTMERMYPVKDMPA